MRIVRRQRFDPFDDRRVIDGIGEITGAERPRRGQAEFEVDPDCLRQMTFPFVHADFRLDAQIVDEDGVHVEFTPWTALRRSWPAARLLCSRIRTDSTRPHRMSPCSPP